jgi:hypothetical protein
VGPVLYFSDCQTGAAVGCVPGNNANPGTLAAPKQNLSGINLNGLAAGTTLLFARGGAWNHAATRLENLNVTPTAPLVFDAYGSGAAPILRTASGTAFSVGGLWGNTTNDGGYTFRNLTLDGLGSAQWGLWFVQNVRSVLVENVTITGFEIAVHSAAGAPYGVNSITIRNSNISRNSSMGLLGTMNDAVIENSLFEGNNFRGTVLEHAIYYSGGRNTVIRNNRFLRNSVVNGVCTGGNVTVHGMVDSLTIENNLIEQTAGTSSCLGFSIIPGYTIAEWFRNVVVRGNTIVNVGTCAVCAGSAPGIVIEDNRAFKTNSEGLSSVTMPIGAGDALDAVDSNPVVRNNLLCQATPPANSRVVNINVSGAVVSGNELISGADALNGLCAR